jgi:ATP-dependent RNA helicase RhlE
MTLFEKLNLHFEETFPSAGMEKPNELQEKVLQRIKQGGDLLVIAGKSSGKSLAAAIACLEKVPEQLEGSPRAIIICSTSEQAKKTAEFIVKVSRRKEIYVELAHDKGNMIEQRNHIFEGADIVVGTAKRIFDLYIQNGINMGKLKLFILDDAETMLKESTIGQLRRIADSLPKCQRIIFASTHASKLEKIMDDLLVNPMELEMNA